MEKHLKRVPNAIAAQHACVGEGNREGGAAEAILPQLGKEHSYWLKNCTDGLP